MEYTIVGLRENGQLAAYDCVATDVSLEMLERICVNNNYSQALVLENECGNSGTVKRYEYRQEPSLREVPA